MISIIDVLNISIDNFEKQNGYLPEEIHLGHQEVESLNVLTTFLGTKEGEFYTKFRGIVVVEDNVKSRVLLK